MKIFLDRDYFFNFVRQKKMTIIKVALGLFVLTLAFFAFTLREGGRDFELNNVDKEILYDIAKKDGEIDLVNSENLGSSDEVGSKEGEEEAEPVEIFVDVGGAVVNPDVYKLKRGSRVYEAIKKAGGFTENANAQNINLAAVLHDQDKIVILTEEELEGQSGKSSAAEGVQSAEAISGAGKSASSAIALHGNDDDIHIVNINTATESELQMLKGVGPAMAKRIIDYRTGKGSFSRIDELKNVKGIGDKMFQKIKDYVRV